jgi:hypothetical protein
MNETNINSGFYFLFDLHNYNKVIDDFNMHIQNSHSYVLNNRLKF